MIQIEAQTSKGKNTLKLPDLGDLYISKMCSPEFEGLLSLYTLSFKKEMKGGSNAEHRVSGHPLLITLISASIRTREAMKIDKALMWAYPFREPTH